MNFGNLAGDAIGKASTGGILSLLGRNDVFLGARFSVWIMLDAIIVAGFTHVSGLQMETQTEEYEEGGVNDYVHRFPKRTTFPPLVLRRGMTIDYSLWNWHKQAVLGKIKRKHIYLVLLDHSGTPVAGWVVYDGFPTKWIGPELNASSSDVAVEQIEITHTGLKAWYGFPMSLV